MSLTSRIAPTLVAALLAGCGGALAPTTEADPAKATDGRDGDGSQERGASTGSRDGRRRRGGARDDDTADAPAQGTSRLAAALGALTLVRSDETTLIPLVDGGTLSLKLAGYDAASVRSLFHLTRTDAAGSVVDVHDIASGPADVGGELEVEKTGTSSYALVTVPRSTRWGTGPYGTLGDCIAFDLGEEGEIDVGAGRTVRLTFTGYDDASNRARFHYVLSGSDGTAVETRDVAYGPADIGWEVESLKASAEHALVTIAASSRWLAKDAIDTHRGAAMLLGTAETADVTTPIGETLAYLGHDTAAGSDRSAFHYVAKTGDAQLITMGPRDIGWEIEVLKSGPDRSLVTLAVSTRP